MPASTSPVPPSTSSFSRCCGRIAYLIGPKKVEWTPIAVSATSSSGMLWSSSPAAPNSMITISALLTMRMISALSLASASWPASADKQEEGGDEQAAGDRAEGRFLLGIAIDAVDHQQHHRGAEQIVVEGAEELRDEQRQEAARAQQMGDVLDQRPRRAGCSRWGERHSQLCAPPPNAITRSRPTMLTLPNLLTLSRIFAVPILVFLLWKPAPLRLSRSPSCSTASSGSPIISTAISPARRGRSRGSASSSTRSPTRSWSRRCW